jgi:hypothetical protein
MPRRLFHTLVAPSVLVLLFFDLFFFSTTFAPLCAAISVVLNGIGKSSRRE